MSWLKNIAARVRATWQATRRVARDVRLWLRSRDGRPRVYVETAGGGLWCFEVTARVVDEVRAVLIDGLGLEDLSQSMRALTEEQREELIADVFRRFNAEDLMQGGHAITKLYRCLVDCTARQARNATPEEVEDAVDFFCAGYHSRVTSAASLALRIGTPPSLEPYSSPAPPAPAMPLPST